MSEPVKKQKTQQLSNGNESKPDFEKIYDNILAVSRHSEDHPYVQLLKNLKLKKHPILQVIQPQNDIYKTNPEKKKKPIQLYLDTVNHLYKKRDLDILINPVTPSFVFEKWAPREVAIFEEAILRFGKQFEFIAELIGTKNAKDSGNPRATLNRTAVTHQPTIAATYKITFDDDFDLIMVMDYKYMLRTTGSLFRTVRFGYNNFNNWRRYHKNFPLQSEQKIFKREFKEGDQPEFIYDSNIAWPQEYKPWKNQVPYEYAIGFALLILYADWRTDRIRENEGITETHPNPV